MKIISWESTLWIWSYLWRFFFSMKCTLVSKFIRVCSVCTGSGDCGEDEDEFRKNMKIRNWRLYLESQLFESEVIFEDSCFRMKCTLVSKFIRVCSVCTGSGDCGEDEDEFRKNMKIRNWRLYLESQLFESEVIFEDSFYSMKCTLVSKFIRVCSVCTGSGDCGEDEDEFRKNMKIRNWRLYLESQLFESEVIFEDSFYSMKCTLVSKFLRVCSVCTGSGDCGEDEDEFRKNMKIRNWRLYLESQLFESEVIFEDSCFSMKCTLVSKFIRVCSVCTGRGDCGEDEDEFRKNMKIRNWRLYLESQLFESEVIFEDSFYSMKCTLVSKFIRVCSVCTGRGDCGEDEDEFRKNMKIRNWRLYLESQLFESEVIFEDSFIPWSVLLFPSFSECVVYVLVVVIVGKMRMSSGKTWK